METNERSGCPSSAQTARSHKDIFSAIRRILLTRVVLLTLRGIGSRRALLILAGRGTLSPRTRSYAGIAHRSIGRVARTFVGPLGGTRTAAGRCVPARARALTQPCAITARSCRAAPVAVCPGAIRLSALRRGAGRASRSRALIGSASIGLCVRRLRTIARLAAIAILHRVVAL